MASYNDLVQIWALPLLLALVFLAKKKKKKNNNNLPPGPPKLPIIGNLHQLGESAHVSLRNLAKKHGPVMHLHIGSIPTLVVSSPEAAGEVLKTHDLKCCSRPSLTGIKRLTYNYLDIGFSPYGDYWREARKLAVVHLLNTKRVESFGLIREQEVALLIDSISRSLEPSSPSSEVNLSEKILTMAENTMYRIALGESFRGSELDKARVRVLIRETVRALESFCASDFLPYVGWIVDWFRGFHGRLEKTFHGMDAFYQGVIDDHLDPERVEDREDMVDILLNILKDQNKFGGIPFQLTHDHMKAILMDLHVGGSGSSADTITWAMAELARNRRVMKKVQDEIRSCTEHKGKVSWIDLEKFQYLKMVVKETLRLHPPGALLTPRETISHFKINGYDIRPKTLVLVNTWAIGRDDNVWERPEEFHPERFEDSLVDYKGQHFELLPFGAGRRVCPGLVSAIATVELALASMLYLFDWELPNGMKEEDLDMEEEPGVVVHKKLPLKLVPISYSSLKD